MCPAAGDAGTAACFCLHAIAGKWCNGSGCGGCLLNGNRLARSQSRPALVGGAALVIGSTSKLATLIRLLENFTMMFDHPLGEPLGPFRKRSGVESAKRIWRVSFIFPPVSVCEGKPIWLLQMQRIVWCLGDRARNWKDLERRLRRQQTEGDQPCRSLT